VLYSSPSLTVRGVYSRSRAAFLTLLIVVVTALNAAAQTTSEPQKITEETVPYPEGGRGNAEVVLELDISEEGTVTAAKLRRGRNPFARAARSAVLAWRFSPALRNGNKVPARVLTRITFVDPLPIIPALDTQPGVSGDAQEVPLLDEEEGGEALDQVVILA
jgi:TonB family protein